MEIFMCGCDVVTETVQQVELFVCSRGLIGRMLHVICFFGVLFFFHIDPGFSFSTVVAEHDLPCVCVLSVKLCLIFSIMCFL